MSCPNCAILLKTIQDLLGVQNSTLMSINVQPPPEFEPHDCSKHSPTIVCPPIIDITQNILASSTHSCTSHELGKCPYKLGPGRLEATAYDKKKWASAEEV